jgi:hypothetical protein
MDRTPTSNISKLTTVDKTGRFMNMSVKRMAILLLC